MGHILTLHVGKLIFSGCSESVISECPGQKRKQKVKSLPSHLVVTWPWVMSCPSFILFPSLLKGRGWGADCL